jgi:hypothetical protein
MACSSQPGPARAIRFIEEHIAGVKITQKDWHTLREVAAEHTGVRLSKVAATELGKVRAARALAAALHVTPSQSNDFVHEFMFKESTEGTCLVLEYVAQNGLPEEVINRPRRNRGRQAGIKTAPPDDTRVPVIGQDSKPTIVNLNGVREKVHLYRVMFQGELIGVTLTQEMAEKIAFNFNRKRGLNNLKEL